MLIFPRYPFISASSSLPRSTLEVESSMLDVHLYQFLPHKNNLAFIGRRSTVRHQIPSALFPDEICIRAYDFLRSGARFPLKPLYRSFRDKPRSQSGSQHWRAIRQATRVRPTINFQYNQLKPLKITY